RPSRPPTQRPAAQGADPTDADGATDTGPARPATGGRPERDVIRRAASAPAEPDPAREPSTGPARPPSAEGRAGGGAPGASDTAGPLPRTAPRFVRLRAQHTDAMTPPPPPPASARFP
ncbi:hypothetical protein KMS84_39170, partial [Streptomyces sp. IBSBF 2807]|nr:hypothetical protein [Streptomyces hilarionis]